MVRLMPRVRAASVQFLLSVLVALATFALIHELWYPWGLFEVAGGRDLFILIATVNVVIGPMLTFVVFIPGKKGLVFDLVAIAAMQLGALTYGMHVLYGSRPVFLVFSKDRFELMRANDFDEKELAKAKEPFASLPLTGPRVVGAELPTNREELDALVFGAAAGVDIPSFPRYYVAYDRVRSEALKHSAPLAKLRQLNPTEAVDEAVRKAALPEQDLRFLAVRAGKIDLTALVDARGADVVRVVALRPWEFK